MAKKQVGALRIIFVALLWIGAFLSALAVVNSTFEVRQITIKLEALRKSANALQVISGQFLLEKSAQAEYSRVEREARKKLQMINPDPSNTILVEVQ